MYVQSAILYLSDKSSNSEISRHRAALAPMGRKVKRGIMAVIYPVRGAVCTNKNAPKSWWNNHCQFISGNERYAVVYCRINHKKGSASTLWIVKRDDLEVHEAGVRAKVVPMWDNADSDSSNFLAAMYNRLVERAKELNQESAAKEYAETSAYHALARSGSNPVALRGGGF